MSVYCISKKCWLILYRKLLYRRIGQNFWAYSMITVKNRSKYIGTVHPLLTIICTATQYAPATFKTGSRYARRLLDSPPTSEVTCAFTPEKSLMRKGFRNHVVVVYITVQEVVTRPKMFNNILAQYIPLFEGQNLYTPGSYLL